MAPLPLLPIILAPSVLLVACLCSCLLWLFNVCSNLRRARRNVCWRLHRLFFPTRLDAGQSELCTRMRGEPPLLKPRPSIRVGERDKKAGTHATERPLAVVALPTSAPTKLDDPARPRTDRHILVGSAAGTLSELTHDGQRIATVGFRDEREYPLTSLAAEGSQIFVADAANHRVQMLLPAQHSTALPAPAMRTVQQCGAVRRCGFAKTASKGAADKLLKRPPLLSPAGLAVCTSGPFANSLFVSDAHDRVMVFGTQWLEPRMCIGSSGTRRGAFRAPLGLAVHNERRLLLVCDAENDRLQMLSLGEAGRCSVVRVIGAPARAARRGRNDATEQQGDEQQGDDREGNAADDELTFKLRSPCAVCVADGPKTSSASQLVFVADKGGALGSRIVALALDGEPLQIFCTHGLIRDLGIFTVRGSAERILLAVDEKYHALRVFALSGAAAGARALPPSTKPSAPTLRHAARRVCLAARSVSSMAPPSAASIGFGHAPSRYAVHPQAESEEDNETTSTLATQSPPARRGAGVQFADMPPAQAKAAAPPDQAAARPSGKQRWKAIGNEMRAERAVAAWRASVDPLEQARRAYASTAAESQARASKERWKKLGYELRAEAVLAAWQPPPPPGCACAPSGA